MASSSRTVADLLADQELAELEAEASAILANLEEVLGRIRALKGAG